MVERDLHLVRADRRPPPRRPCLDRRGDRGDPPGQGARAAGHLRHRAALFRAERDRGRRLPHLRQAVAAAAHRGGPAGGRSRGCATAPSTPSPATTRRRTRTPSALPFAQAAFGGIGLETLLPMSLELYHNGHLPLLDVLRADHLRPGRPAGPAGRAAGQGRAGRSRRCSIPTRLAGRASTSSTRKSKNTPFDGRPVQGRVLMTIVDGRRVFALADEVRSCAR